MDRCSCERVSLEGRLRIPASTGTYRNNRFLVALPRILLLAGSVCTGRGPGSVADDKERIDVVDLHVIR